MHTSPLVLRLGSESSSLEHSGDENISAVQHIAIGWQKILPSGQMQRPPTEFNLEMAIQYIEDAIMLPLNNLQTDSDTLTVVLPNTFANLPIPTNTPGRYLIEPLEDAFRRLCEIADGSPIGNDAVLIVPETVAILLILREMMHHGGFIALDVSAEETSGLG